MPDEPLAVLPNFTMDGISAPEHRCNLD